MFSNKEITLKAGEVLSSTVEVTIKPLSKEMVDSGKKYALPVGIVGANTSLLAGASSILYQLERLLLLQFRFLIVGIMLSSA